MTYDNFLAMILINAEYTKIDNLVFKNIKMNEDVGEIL
jgi:hypothetical protein